MNKEELINKLNDENLSTEETIQLRGQLIKLLKKEIKEAKDNKVILPLRLQLYEELKKHKEALKRRGKEDKISIPKRVALKVKEIANTITLFKEKYDVVGKIKNTAIGTAVSSLLAGAVTVGLSALGGPVTIATVAAAVPTMCYCGLSGILRMPFTETGWSKLVKSVDSQEKNKELIVAFIEQNVKNDQELNELLNKRNTKQTEKELIENNNKLLLKYQALISKCPQPDLAKMLTFEKINLLEEQKKVLENIKQEYIKDKRKLTVAQFADLEKALISINVTIAKENSYIKEVAKETGKNFVISSGTMLAARGIMACLFPSYAINEIASLGLPLIFTTIGSVANMGELKNKIQLEKEAYDKLKVNINSAKLKEMMSKEQNAKLALA